MHKEKGNLLFFWLSIIIASIVLTIALLLQSNEGLEPCPLCVLQRLAIIIVIVVSFLALIHRPGLLGTKIYWAIITLINMMGIAVAGRHVWLQQLPKDQVPSCGPTFEYLIENLPFKEALTTILQGSGQCAEIVWQFLGLSIPEWSLIAFSILVLISLFGLLKTN